MNILQNFYKDNFIALVFCCKEKRKIKARQTEEKEEGVN